MLPAGEKLKPNCWDAPGETSASLLFPGAKGAAYTRNEHHRVTQEEVDWIRSGTRILYFYGELRYVDIFGEAHSTTFCSELEADLQGFTSCGADYNNAN